MAFLSGSVADMTELMTTLRNFVTGAPGTPGRDWTLEELRPTRDSSGNEIAFGTPRNEWVISNVGENELEHIIVGFREYQNLATGNFGCNLNCYTSFTPGYANFNQNGLLHNRGAYGATYGSYYQMPLLPLSNSAMAYWFFSNRNRIIVVVRTGSYYQSCYLGFGIRQGSPSEYPYPLVAIGTVNGYPNHVWTTLNSWANFFVDPNLGTVDSNSLAPFVVDPMGNYSTQLGTPWKSLFFRPGSGDFIFSYSSDTNLFTYGADGKIMMFPVYISMGNSVLMSLDGACRVTFSNPDLISEDVLVHEGKQWIVFNSVYRVTRDMYMAINTGIDAE